MFVVRGMVSNSQLPKFDSCYRLPRNLATMFLQC